MAATNKTPNENIMLKRSTVNDVAKAAYTTSFTTLKQNLKRKRNLEIPSAEGQPDIM